MSFIGKNIKKIRTVKNLSQAAFAQLFELARPSVGAYEEGRSEPKIDTLVQISQHFGISVDLLLTKELTVNELYGFDIFKKNYSQNELLKGAAAAVENSLLPAVPFISAQSISAYLKKSADLSQFPTLILPLQSTTAARAFEISGDEMQQPPHGLKRGDVVVGISIDNPATAKLRQDQVYVVVTADQILIRRLTSSPVGELALKADNPTHQTINVPLGEVKELWEVQGVYTSVAPAPAPLEERLTLLEQTVQELSQRLKQLEK